MKKRFLSVALVFCIAFSMLSGLISVKAAGQSISSADIVSVAKSLVGQYPYVYGGESPSEGGFDCTGLVYYVYHTRLGHYMTLGQARSKSLLLSLGQKITNKADFLPGDILQFTYPHVAIYIGNNKMIEAAKPGTYVREASITYRTDIEYAIRLPEIIQSGTPVDTGDSGDNGIINGVYSLTPKCAPNSRLDVYNGSKEKGANIQIYQANNTEAQQFEFKYLGEGYYEIISKVSGKALDVQNGNNKSGANVWQYDSNSTDAQKWMLEKTEDGYYYIIPKLNTNLCLDVYNAKKDNGTNVQVWNKNQSDAQKWKLTSVQSPVQSSNSLPTNLTVSTDKNSYTLGESVLITPSANNATHYAISVWKGAFGTGDRVYVNFKIPGRISFNPTQSGTYTIRVDAKNGAGYISTEKTFTVAATAPGEPTEQKTWGNWSNWSTDYVESSDTRQVETTSVKVADPYTEYRYGRYIDSTGTHVCWCKKYLESWRSVSGSASLQYSEWSATRYNANGKAWTCGYCGGDHTGVHHVSSDGRAWWAQFDLPSGSYYWEESRNVDTRYETQYRYRDLISR